MFVQKLCEAIKDKKSIVCMGLDPRLESEGQIPDYLKKEYNNPNDIILEFNKTLIDDTHDLIPVIKPQMAFYEKYDAIEALKSTISYALKKDLLVILDAKRNDIGATSEAYADAIFNNYGPDACTINAYFGFDGVKPFLDYKDKGKFVLVKTSNPSSSEFQNLFSASIEDCPENKVSIEVHSIELKRNYIRMAELINKWGKELEKFENYTNLGAVVGATYPNELKNLRKVLNNSFLLIPGYGTQGGTAKDIVNGVDKSGLGAIVSASRSIMFAYQKKGVNPEDFSKAARNEIIRMNKEISKALTKK